MKKSTKLWQLWGFAVTSLFGTLLHFLYDLCGKSLWVAPFSAINESTWEHMKLLFLPTFIFAIVQSFFFRERKNFWCIKLRAILLGLLLVPVIFYTYNGAIGKSPDWVNIAIFFICAAVLYIYEIKLFKDTSADNCNGKLALAILCVISLLFFIFTFKTPQIGLFKDPLTGSFGV